MEGMERKLLAVAPPGDCLAVSTILSKSLKVGQNLYCSPEYLEERPSECVCAGPGRYLLGLCIMLVGVVSACVCQCWEYHFPLHGRSSKMHIQQRPECSVALHRHMQCTPSMTTQRQTSDGLRGKAIIRLSLSAGLAPCLCLHEAWTAQQDPGPLAAAPSRQQQAPLGVLQGKAAGACPQSRAAALLKFGSREHALQGSCLVIAVPRGPLCCDEPARF